MLDPIANSSSVAAPTTCQLPDPKQPKFSRFSPAPTRTQEIREPHSMHQFTLVKTQFEVFSSNMHPRKLVGWQNRARRTKRRN
jgi:hypothetical protein